MRDFADLARLGHVTRARITQIMNLLLLAPDIQEVLLTLAGRSVGVEETTERDLRNVTALIDWQGQRAAWQEMFR